jgi:hypothetical protein
MRSPGHDGKLPFALRKENLMYRVIRGREVRPEQYEYRGEVEGRPYSGVSSQPLLDACRQIKRMGGDRRELCCLFYEGREDWILRVKVGVGAGMTVRDPSKGNGPRFIKFQEFPVAVRQKY